MKEVKYFIVDYRMPNNYVNRLEEFEVPIIKTIPLNNGDLFLNGHPDLALHQVSDDTVVVENTLIDYYREKLPDKKLIPSYKKVEKDYPSNIGLNVFRYNDYVFHNIKYMDKNIKDYYLDRNYNFINIKQGYAKCSIASVNDSLITSDRGIYEKAKKHLNCLLIDHKQIKLKGFDYGFIGGASGSIRDSLILTGNINNHSSKKDIECFVQRNNLEIKYLSSEEIEDYGSILSIY